MKVYVRYSKRMNNTANGNPVWRIETSAETFLTKPDANWVSGIVDIPPGPYSIKVEATYVTSLESLSE